MVEMYVKVYTLSNCAPVGADGTATPAAAPRSRLEITTLLGHIGPACGRVVRIGAASLDVRFGWEPDPVRFA